MDGPAWDAINSTLTQLGQFCATPAALAQPRVGQTFSSLMASVSQLLPSSTSLHDSSSGVNTARLELEALIDTASLRRCASDHRCSTQVERSVQAALRELDANTQFLDELQSMLQGYDAATLQASSAAHNLDEGGQLSSVLSMRVASLVPGVSSARLDDLMRLPSELARVVQPTLEAFHLEVAAVSTTVRAEIRDEAQRLTGKITASADYALDAVQLKDDLRNLSDTAAEVFLLINRTVAAADTVAQSLAANAPLPQTEPRDNPFRRLRELAFTRGPGLWTGAAVALENLGKAYEAAGLPTPDTCTDDGRSVSDLAPQQLRVLANVRSELPHAEVSGALISALNEIVCAATSRVISATVLVNAPFDRSTDVDPLQSLVAGRRLEESTSGALWELGSVKRSSGSGALDSLAASLGIALPLIRSLSEGLRGAAPTEALLSEEPAFRSQRSLQDFTDDDEDYDDERPPSPPPELTGTASWHRQYPQLVDCRPGLGPEPTLEGAMACMNDNGTDAPSRLPECFAEDIKEDDYCANYLGASCTDSKEQYETHFRNDFQQLSFMTKRSNLNPYGLFDNIKFRFQVPLLSTRRVTP